ncbi:MAG: hypothetical protein H6732_08990 [Alphaproteobacteria bacterium]|nr:hypothetical protein [Alphaproteobacteria bacterium]
MSGGRIPPAVSAVLARRLSTCPHRPATLRVQVEEDGWVLRLADEVGRPAIWRLAAPQGELVLEPVLVDAAPDTADWTAAVEAALPELAALPGVIRRVMRRRGP